MGTQRKFTLQLDFRSRLPIYLQIVRQIERQALGPRRRRSRPGDQLPTVRGLALQLGVNFNTVARAYRLLNNAGFVSTQRGRGTYIIEMDGAATVSRTTQVGVRSRRVRLRDLAREYIVEAKRNGFSEEEIQRMVKVALNGRKAAR